jgi:membrane carboxypeptidase/penicillin-binding protein PbpC
MMQTASQKNSLSDPQERIERATRARDKVLQHEEAKKRIERKERERAKKSICWNEITAYWTAASIHGLT